MKPYHRSRPVPPPASCRSGPGSREVSPENGIFSAMRKPTCVRWTSGGRSADTMCRLMRPRRLSGSLCGHCSAGRSSIGRSGYDRSPGGGGARHGPTSSNRRSSTFVQPHAAHLGARQDCDRSAGRGLPNLGSDGRADPEISQEKQAFFASGPPADPRHVPTQSADRKAVAPTNPERGYRPTPCFCAIPPVAESIS